MTEISYHVFAIFKDADKHHREPSTAFGWSNDEISKWQIYPSLDLAANTLASTVIAPLTEQECAVRNVKVVFNIPPMHPKIHLLEKPRNLTRREQGIFEAIARRRVPKLAFS